MSALARLLLLKNQKVSGSDQKSSSLVDELENLGAEVFVGHDQKQLPSSGRVVVSTGINPDNVELKGCLPENHEVIHRSTLLKELMEGYQGLAIAGSHGKTTTSSLLVTVLTEANKNPTWAVGGIISSYGTNAALGSGPYFVAEVDESDGTHEKYHPYGLIVTNIDEEHMDYYKSKEKLFNSFRKLASQTLSKEHLFYCIDNAGLRELSFEGVSYGFSQEAELKITSFEQTIRGIKFSLSWKNMNYDDIELPLYGRHNALNGSAVFGLGLSLGLDEALIRKGFQAFKGAKRRLDVKLSKNEVIIFDDYAHHPTEIQVTLEALKEAYPDRRLVVFFQPHRFTRTEACFHQFKAALERADSLFLTDIYGAGETPIEGITTSTLLKEMGRGKYIPRKDLFESACSFIRPFDVVVMMGAGDITEVAEKFAHSTPRKLLVGALFGGKSEEHEVSLLSAKGVTQAFNKELFEVAYFGITKKGNWIFGDNAKRQLNQNRSLDNANNDEEKTEIAQAINELYKCDLIFPILHGTNGEDGKIQGFLETLGLPYISSNVESSAISMNKAISKKLSLAAKIPVAPFVSFTKNEWALEREAILANIDQELSYPLFVKAVHLGSSIGIYKVDVIEQLIPHIEKAFTFDSELIVENGVKGRELECSVLGSGPWIVSNPGEIGTNGRFYDYESKYGPKSFDIKVTADLTEEEQAQAKKLAVQIYRAVGCDMMARVDLFLTDKGFLFNEVNPIPGFTPYSLFTNMLEATGIDYSSLLNHLSKLALHRSLKG